jgi:hypothetical protein
MKSIADLRSIGSGRAGASSALDAVGFFFLDTFIAAIIVAHLIYIFAFNYLPDEVRLQAAGALFGAQILLTVWALVTRPALWNLLIAAALAIKIVCWFISTATGDTVVRDQAELLRIATREVVPYLVVIWVLTYSSRLPWRLVCLLCLTSSVIAGVLALAGEPVVLLGVRRLAAFTGGNVAIPDHGADQLGLHSSAYFILLCLFQVDGIRRAGLISARWSNPVLCFLLILLIQYQVRTTFIMLAAYVIGHIWRSRWRRLLIEGGSIVAAIILICGAAVLALADILGDVETWGSGRVESYQFRITMVIQRDLMPLIFGTGPGSDLMVIPAWWWGAKDSHSDLFHTLVETGILGTIGLAIFFCTLWSRLNATGRPLLWGLLASSAISNGLLSRPPEFFLLALAMAVAEQHADRPGIAARRRRAPSPGIVLPGQRNSGKLQDIMVYGGLATWKRGEPPEPTHDGDDPSVKTGR